MAVFSPKEIFRRIHAKEVALCDWAKEGSHFRPSRQQARLPKLDGCMFETGTVPGIEQFLSEYNLGDTEFVNSRWFYDIVYAVSENLERGWNLWAMSREPSVFIFRELKNRGTSHIGCVHLEFQYTRPTLRLNPKYTAWGIRMTATDCSVSTLGNVLTHWQYNVKTRSASKSLAADYAGSGLRRMMDGSYKTRQSEIFALRDRFLLSHRFTELLWPSSRISSVGELIQEFPEHRRFFEEVVAALRNTV